jgi:Domain of unknown function (DUF1992)
MTERKPGGMTFTSWIDKQIAEATERGAFDNLPGAGKPIPHRGDEDAAQAWLREYLRKEGVSAEALLPTPLRLRKAIDRLATDVPGMGSEDEVREAVGELNHQIREWRRIPLGPPIFVPLVDEDAMVSRWHAARPGPAVPSAARVSEAGAALAAPSGRSRRWRGRRRRGAPGPGPR